MPSPEAIKKYQEQSCYHIYNRGINRENIFFSDKDYWIFRKILRRVEEKYCDEVKIRSFALMPNHFHLLVFQKHDRSIVTFMKSLTASYSRYVQEKYSRVGPLYQGRYKGILITSDKHYEQIQNYIFANPLEAGLPSWKHVGKTP